MKKLLQSYASFSRTERLGLICLCSLLLALILFKGTMRLWVHPQEDTEKEKQLLARWEAFRHNEPEQVDNTTTPAPVKDFQDAGDQSPIPLPDTININTADSATLVRLKGIGPVTAHKIIVRRSKQGPFKNISQLSEAGHFSAGTLQLLGKHIVFHTPAK